MMQQTPYKNIEQRFINGNVEMFKGDKKYSYQPTESLFLNAYVFDLTLGNNSAAGTKLRDEIKSDIISKVGKPPYLNSLIDAIGEAIQNAYMNKENEPYPDIYATLTIDDKKDITIDIMNSGTIDKVAEVSKKLKLIKSKEDIIPYLKMKIMKREGGGLGLPVMALSTDRLQYTQVENLSIISMTKIN